MTLEIALIFLIILALIVVFAFELLPVDNVAIVLMVVLIVSGFVSPSEGISGFSNQATITVLSLMILSIGLETTGVIRELGNLIKPMFEKEEYITLFFLMLIVGTCSAFVSTTAVVIVFMRMVIKLSEKVPNRISKLLMPLSFAGILGGSCTLLGTSTNLIVNSFAKENGVQSFGVFEFSHIGLAFFVAALIYMVFLGRHLIPIRKKSEDLTESYTIKYFFTEIEIAVGSSLAGKLLHETWLHTDDEIDIVEIKRPGGKGRFPTEKGQLEEGVTLLLKASLEKIAELRASPDIVLLPRRDWIDDERLNTEEMVLCEAIIRPNSILLGKSLSKADLKREFNAIPLAVKKQSQTYTTNLGEIKMDSGDNVLLEVAKDDFERVYNMPDLVVLKEYEGLSASDTERFMAVAIVVLVVVLAATNVLNILTSALAGVVAMFLTGCLNLQQAYRRVDWSVFFLLAGVIPLGIAMDNVGASQYLADSFVAMSGKLSANYLVAILFLVTTLLSGIISNNATAILMAPIAFSIGNTIGLDPRPLLLVVMFAANASFISPIGYQTNTLIYGPGDYRFADYFKVGGLLTIIVWILCTILIPYFYF